MYFIGLMSGTSSDGIDAVLVNFDEVTPRCVVAARHTKYPPGLLQDLLALTETTGDEFPKLDQLDQHLGVLFADAAMDLLHTTGIDKSRIVAIGSHGHTVRHAPHAEKPYSLQIGDADTIASTTGITTVADFRTADIAMGGQGAPLVPAFHRAVFGDCNTNRCICNIGGIANVTGLPAGNGRPVLGFDTGPGNTLLDHWINREMDLDYDAGGGWAQSGTLIEPLLAALMSDTYFDLAPPKSTGKEHFNLAWLTAIAGDLLADYDPADIQATLAALTARTITAAISRFLPGIQEIYVCGGGCHNTQLMRLIADRCLPIPVKTTDALGFDPDWVEAAAFAWLAQRTLAGKPGNLPSVTGARRPVVLGSIHSPGGVKTRT